MSSHLPLIHRRKRANRPLASLSSCMTPDMGEGPIVAPGASWEPVFSGRAKLWACWSSIRSSRSASPLRRACSLQASLSSFSSSTRSRRSSSSMAWAGVGSGSGASSCSSGSSFGRSITQRKPWGVSSFSLASSPFTRRLRTVSRETPRRSAASAIESRSSISLFPSLMWLPPRSLGRCFSTC